MCLHPASPLARVHSERLYTTRRKPRSSKVAWRQGLGGAGSWLEDGCMYEQCIVNTVRGEKLERQKCTCQTVTQRYPPPCCQCRVERDCVWTCRGEQRDVGASVLLEELNGPSSAGTCGTMTAFSSSGCGHSCWAEVLQRHTRNTGPNLLLVSQAGGGVELDLALAVNAVQQLAAHG